MERVNEEINRKVVKRDDRKGYTLIVDPTMIESHKRETQMSYLGFKGYRPVVATLKEIGLVVAYEFKEGNDHGGRVEIWKMGKQVKQAEQPQPKNLFETG